jgi:hypothetical protein
VSLKLEIPVATARKLLDGLANLRSLMDRYSISAQALVESIGASLPTQATARWREQYLDRWAAASPAIALALAAIPPEHPLLMLQKVRELAYNHEKIFLNATLYTELRPVFTAVGDKIKAAVLTQVLILNYQESDESKQIQLALDIEDVVLLRKICERAQLKLATVQQDFGNTIPILVPGAIE